MIRRLFFLSLCFTTTSVFAQLGETPRYFVDLDAGYNLARRQDPMDRAGDGIHLATGFRMYFPLGPGNGISAGPGGYLHHFDYRDNGSLRFGCDLPVELGGQGQQTYLETAVVHAGLTAGFRFHQWLDKRDRWLWQLGGDVLVPLYSSATATVYECGINPLTTSVVGVDRLRTLIPQLTTSLTFGIPTPHPKGEILGVGPFFSYTPLNQFGPGSANVGGRTYTVGLRFSGYRVRR